MKPNHHSLAYKMRAKPNKTYKELKQKQKAKIGEWSFRSVCEYYREHGGMPEGEAAEKIAAQVYEKVKSAAIWDNSLPCITNSSTVSMTRCTSIAISSRKSLLNTSVSTAPRTSRTWS